MMKPINLAEKLGMFSEIWTPRVIGNIDGYQVKLAKIEGDFVWHAHDDEDECFLVLQGRFRMDYRDRRFWVEEGEMIVVPKGVEHKPFAPEQCGILLIERAGTDHTGGVDDPRRVENFDSI